MLCPSCGNPQPDDAGRCSECGHAFNDPAKMHYAQQQHPQTWTVFAVILLLILALVILIWIQFM